MQGKLLVLLQEHTYCSVGGIERVKADIRIVTATNRNLEQLVAEGRFREDLYYRLRVVQIEVPPLRERGSEDLFLLVNHFVLQAVRRHKRAPLKVGQDTMQALLAHRWPGNVRELENCLESAVIFSDGEISPADLSLPHHATPWPAHSSAGPESRFGQRDQRPCGQPSMGGHPPFPFPLPPPDNLPSLQDLEARYIQHLLDLFDGNRSACARILKIGRNTLLRKLQRYGLVGD